MNTRAIVLRTDDYTIAPPEDAYQSAHERLKVRYAGALQQIAGLQQTIQRLEHAHCTCCPHWTVTEQSRWPNRQSDSTTTSIWINADGTIRYSTTP